MASAPEWVKLWTPAPGRSGESILATCRKCGAVDKRKKRKERIRDHSTLAVGRNKPVNSIDVRKEHKSRKALALAVGKKALECTQTDLSHQ